jgi:hypothetical protein
MRAVGIMISSNDEIDRVCIDPVLSRNNLSIGVVKDPNAMNIFGDYFSETKQVQFYGARLTKKQINKIFELIEINQNGQGCPPTN